MSTKNRTVEVIANGTRSGVVAAVPVMAEGGFLTAQTAATGSNWTAFGDKDCRQLTIANNTGTTVEVRQDAAGAAFPVFDRTYITLFGIDNASQIGVRRVDVSNSQVTVAARWEA